MADIRYVVFSDMHLGAENSLFTNVSPKDISTITNVASDFMLHMVNCLKFVLQSNTSSQKPQLVFNGDLMELAFANTNTASMIFQRFFELVMPDQGEGMFENNIVFLPGNHDHNLWERSRNTQYIEYLNSLNSNDFIRDEIHTNSLFKTREIKVGLLNVLIHRYPHLKEVNVTARYPAYGLIQEERQKCVLITHGHYIESMYSLMTSLRSHIFPDRKKPIVFEELEKENYAWVDFFWSTLGRSGSVGKDIDLIYDKLQEPKEVKQIIRNMAESFTGQQKNAILNWLEREVLEELFTFTIGRMAANERNEPQVALSPDALQGLKKYMEVYMYHQLQRDLNIPMPKDFSLLFGHTHKPFQERMNFNGYAQSVKVYNSGGWVVDTLENQPLHGGSVLLIDENLNVAALNFYKEGSIVPHITTLELDHTGQESNDLVVKIKGLINNDKEPWKSFIEIAGREIENRHKYLGKIASSNN